MWRKPILIVVAAIVALMASSASVSAVPCANPDSLVNFAGGCSFTVGSLTITGADTLVPVNGAGLQVLAGSFTVPPGVTLPGIDISGALHVSAGQSLDVRFTYNVVSSGAPITDLHLFFNGAFTGTGTAAVTETILDTDHGILYQLHATNPPFNLSDVAFILPTTHLTINKDILLVGGADGTADISFVQQAFSQVPEPATLLLLGSGFIGMALGQRRFGRKQLTSR